jgi:hypothetical protein
MVPASGVHRSHFHSFLNPTVRSSPDVAGDVKNTVICLTVCSDRAGLWVPNATSELNYRIRFIRSFGLHIGRRGSLNKGMADASNPANDWENMFNRRRYAEFRALGDSPKRALYKACGSPYGENRDCMKRWLRQIKQDNWPTFALE